MQKRFLMAKSLARSGAENLLNRALTFAPLAMQTLGALEGKTIHIQGHSPALTLSLLFSDQYISLSGFEDPAQADACFSGPTFELLRLFRQKKGQPIGNNVHIDGDQVLAQHFLTLIQQLDIDWEEWLSVYLGDIAAHELGRQGRRFGRWAQRVRQSMLRNTREYILYENQALVGNDELLALTKAIQDSAEELTKLDQRIQRLQTRLLTQKVRPL